MKKKVWIGLVFCMTSVYAMAGAPPPPDDEIPVVENVIFLVAAGGLYLSKRLVGIGSSAKK